MKKNVAAFKESFIKPPVKPFASAIGIQGAFLSLVDRVGIFNV